MARERISLVTDDVKKQTDFRSQILSGEMNPQVFATLSADDQTAVNNILFEIASEKVEPNQGTSAIEFILFAFMRITNKRLNGLSLTAEDQEVQNALSQIFSIHQITDGVTAKADWLFDYMGYAQIKAQEFLDNRKEHIQRKIDITGSV